MSEPESPWAGTGPELAIAAVTVAAAGLAGYAVTGWAGLTVVAVAAAGLALVVIRFLLPEGTADAAKMAKEKRVARPVSGYSHRKFLVESGITHRGFYDVELRPVLEHLLAARLAERHGVNLYQDPDAARKLLCGHRRDAVLWQWIDPAAEPHQGDGKRGIPRYVLTRLIDRLEKL